MAYASLSAAHYASSPAGHDASPLDQAAYPLPRAARRFETLNQVTAPTRVDQAAELIAMCPRTANRPLREAVSRGDGPPRFPLPGCILASRGESPGRRPGSRRRARPPGSRPLDLG